MKNPFTISPDIDIFSMRDKESKKAKAVRICALGQGPYKQFSRAGNQPMQNLAHERNNSCQIQPKFPQIIFKSTEVCEERLTLARVDLVEG